MQARHSLPEPDHQRTLDRLGSLADCFALRIIDECTSTNDVLGVTPTADDGKIQVLVARNQTAGRGRRGRSWLSSRDGSLTFSCAWRLEADAQPPSGLSLAAGLAVADAMAALGVRQVALKWPNDVLVEGRKLAGILVELTSGQHRTRSAVIGIGLNLFPPTGSALSETIRATGLTQHLATCPDVSAVLALILGHLHRRIMQYRAGGFASLREDWQKRDAFAGQAVRIEGEGFEHLGICDGIADDGALLLRTNRGTLRIFSGEVSLRAAA